jgi:hypothetical protein
MVALDKYIGEVPVIPTPVANAIHKMFYGESFAMWTNFYYGERTPELSIKFGYLH